MDRLIIKHYLDELPVKILKSAYNIEIYTIYKQFRAQKEALIEIYSLNITMEYDQDIYEKYEENIYMPKNDDEYCADFIEFKIGSWQITMDKKKED
ncbi:MAG: hypothetical protein Q7I98_07370 [Erysipelotrichaceae bacterium]|nr:hypothetical protein [Erysipelotrichaceae bacterium]